MFRNLRTVLFAAAMLIACSSLTLAQPRDDDDRSQERDRSEHKGSDGSRDDHGRRERDGDNHARAFTSSRICRDTSRVTSRSSGAEATSSLGWQSEKKRSEGGAALASRGSKSRDEKR